MLVVHFNLKLMELVDKYLKKKLDNLNNKYKDQIQIDLKCYLKIINIKWKEVNQEINSKNKMYNVHLNLKLIKIVQFLQEIKIFKKDNKNLWLKNKKINKKYINKYYIVNKIVYFKLIT